MVVNSYLFDKDTFICAIKNDSLETMQWLKENGCKFYPPNKDIFLTKDTYNWLKDNGYPLTNFRC